MKKISEILIESEKTRMQSFGGLVEGPDYAPPDSYCALGAIGCEIGLIKKSSDEDGLSYDGILREAGVSSIMINEMYKCPKCKTDRSGLANLIWHMNDSHHSSFKQIGNALRKYKL